MRAEEREEFLEALHGEGVLLQRRQRDTRSCGEGGNKKKGASCV